MTKPTILYDPMIHLSNENEELLAERFEAIPLKGFISDEISPLAIFISVHNIEFIDQWIKHFPSIGIIATNTTTQYYNGPLKYIYLNDKKFLETITPTAEHTLGLILACHRNIRRAERHVMRGNWSRYTQAAPKMLSKSNACIVGFGRVGKLVMERITPLFNNVSVVDIDGGEAWKEWLLPKTDVLIITASANTTPIVTKEVLELLPKDAILINTSSGTNVDLKALIDALEHGTIRGAALDVLPDDHTMPSNKSAEVQRALNYHSKMNNLIITPHMAGSTEDAWHLTQRWVIDRLIEGLS